VSRVEVIGDATLAGFSKYVIRRDGEIVSLWGRNPRVLTGGRDKDGYRKFVLIDDAGERRYMRRAIMVCTAFHGPRPEGMTVRHYPDGTRTNDAATNLSWAPHSVNCQDKLEHGTAQRGTNNGNATITEAAARRIKEMVGIPAGKVAAEIGCTKHVVNNIRSGSSWRWL
jgi:hypothetical protein